MRAVLRAVQINHMNQLRTGRQKRLRGFYCVLRNLVRSRIISLDQAHAHLVVQVDCR